MTHSSIPVLIDLFNNYFSTPAKEQELARNNEFDKMMRKGVGLLVELPSVEGEVSEKLEVLLMFLAANTLVLRMEAFRTLQKLDPSDVSACLLQMLNSGRYREASGGIKEMAIHISSACAAFETLTPAAWPLAVAISNTPALFEKLVQISRSHEDEMVRLNVTSALGYIGIDHQRMINHLQELSQDNNESIRERARAGLAEQQRFLAKTYKR